MDQDLSAEEGSVTPMTLVLFAGVVVVMLTLIGALEGWSVHREASLAANAAARAGAQATPLEWRQSQSPGPAAASRARAELANSGFTGSVQVSDRVVRVTVVAPVSHTFPLPGLPTTTSATAEARMVRGVDGSEE